MGKSARTGDWTEAAVKVLEERYLLKDESGKLLETPDDMCLRVARAIASVESKWRVRPEVIEETTEKFASAMRSFRFLPNSPTLMNAGKNNGLQYSACYVLPVEDSLDGIFEAVKRAALIHKSGGGTGFAFSRLRPKNSSVGSTGGKASGPVSFMKVFNAATEAVKQGGTRRGANMGILRVDHPDILEFIDCKLDGGVTNFNISVAVTTGFMDALVNGFDYPLIDPATRREVGRLNAGEVFNRIVKAAWRTGDPGLVFLDRINASPANPTPLVGMIEATNPCGEQPLLPNESCLTGDTLVMTERGVQQLRSLDSAYVLSDGGKFRTYERVVSRGVKPVYSVKLSNGLSIRATEDHLIMADGEMREVRDLDAGMRVSVACDYPLGVFDRYDPEFEMFGWMHGDGWFTENNVGISFNYADGDGDVKDRLLPEFHRVFKTGHLKPLRDDSVSYQLQTTATFARQVCESRDFVPGRAAQKALPGQFYRWTIMQQLSFMRGLFGSDGSIQGKAHNQVYLASTSLGFIQEVQHFLAAIGIHSRQFTANFGPDSNRKPQHKLCITKESAITFARVIGFSSTSKTARFFPGRFTDENDFEVESIIYDQDEEVFDIVEVDGTNSFYANGMLVHNCNLGSLNLGRFIDSKSEDFDWVALANHVKLGVRFLDDVIEANPYPLEDIDRMVKSNRRIGLGVMGWADALIQLGIPYNSREALELGRKVMEFITDAGHIASQNLAKDRGEFPNFKKSIYKDGPPMRNSTVTTIAPTGSISVLAGATSGIEPLFALGYVHNNQQGRKLTIVNPHFHRAMTSIGYEHLADEIAQAGAFTHYTGTLPEPVGKLSQVFQTAHEVASGWHVLMQSAFQAHTDNGVSKTVNLPNSATEEDIAIVYRLAYSEECLGVTVFRDGCKSAQVLNVGTKEVVTAEAPTPEKAEKKEEPELKPRPGIVGGHTHKVETPLGTAYVTVNRNGGDEPFEVFLNVGKAGSDTAAVAEAMGRLISMILRMPSRLSPRSRMEEIVDQLSGIGASRQLGFGKKRVRSLPDAIAQALGEDIKHAVDDPPMVEVSGLMSGGPVKVTPDQASVLKEFFGMKGADFCPACGHATLVYEEGCHKCHNCAHSEC